jgi:ABC-type transport system substrate-binding protein
MNATTQVIGTDYQYLHSYQPSIGFEYRKHERYWRNNRPFMDRFHYPIIPEYASRYAQFVTRNVHIFTPTQTDVINTRRDVPDAIMQRSDLAGGLTVNYFGHREYETSPWRDERVRRAMSMTIDRKTRYEYFADADEFATAGIPKRLLYNSHFSAGSWFWLDPFKNQLGEGSKYFHYDVAEAKKLMEAAGYTEPVVLETHAHAGPNYGARYQESAQIMEDMWESSGLFRVNRNRPTYADWLPRIYQQRDYKGIALAHLGFGGNNDNDISLYNMYHRNSGATYRGIADTQLEGMIERQRRELDANRRETMMHDIQKYLADKMYIITTEGVADSFYFRWPWVRNSAWPIWNRWLAADAPNRTR